MTEWEVIVRRAGVVDSNYNVFTEEALAANDGKVLPLTLEIGGRVIGETTLKYDSGEKALRAQFRVNDPLIAKFVKENPPDIFG